MIHLINNGKGQVKMNFLVGRELWNDIIRPAGKVGDTIEVRSEAHKLVILPYLKMLNLTLIEDGKVTNPPDGAVPNLRVDPLTQIRPTARVEVIDDEKMLGDIVQALWEKTRKVEKEEKQTLLDKESANILSDVISELTIADEGVAPTLAEMDWPEPKKIEVNMESAEAEELMMKTKAELKEQCSDRGLDIRGNKENLVERLLTSE